MSLIHAIEILNTRGPQVIEVCVPGMQGPPGKGVDAVGVHGGVFFTDISPNGEGNVGNKIFTEDGMTLIECSSTTPNVVAHIFAITGHTRYTPIITINGEVVPLIQQADRPTFIGTLPVTLDDSGSLTVKHEDGAEHSINILTDAPPQILSAMFIGNYPGVQTELKENDVMRFRVETDIPVIQLEVENFGAFKPFSSNVSGTEHEFMGTIANRGNVAQEQTFKVRVQKETGAWSDWFESTNTVILNNIYPSIVVNSITYPVNQSALKDNEEAIINHSVSNFDTINYTSTQLNILNSTTYESTKSVFRIGGTYNINTNNLVILANRIANDASSSYSTIVRIAHAIPIININSPSRLRSGGNLGTSPQNHTITITANQHLMSAPSLDAPVGTWQGTGFSGTAGTWARTLRIHDNDPKGTFTFTNLQARSLSNQIVNVISNGSNYVVGGFVFRILTIPAYPVRSADIGTVVVNTSKIRCTNLSKGLSGSLNFQYQSSTDNAINKYTILNSNEWYNCDGPNATSNTTGTMQIELEEVV